MKPNLTSRYLGFELRNPLVVSACPLTGRLETLLRLEDAGAAAVVLPSLFQEQIEQEALELAWLKDYGTESYPEATHYLPAMSSYNTGPAGYLGLIEKARKSLDIPVIASLNGTTLGGWTSYARQMVEAGAQALELNIYFMSTDPEVTGAQVEDRYVELVAAVRQAVEVPLAVKLGPSFSAFAHMAQRLTQAGANALVLFNRYFFPDIDLEAMQVSPQMVLSTPDEVRLPLRWIAVLKDKIRVDLAATTGVHGPEEAVKLLLAGADAVQVAGVLMRHGPEYLRWLLSGLQAWLDERNYDSVEQLKGSLCMRRAPDPTAYERANYVQTLTRYSSKLHG